eukprot:11551555-Karenia_brevis.AAC.1
MDMAATLAPTSPCAQTVHSRSANLVESNWQQPRAVTRYRWLLPTTIGMAMYRTSSRDMMLDGSN